MFAGVVVAPPPRSTGSHRRGEEAEAGQAAGGFSRGRAVWRQECGSTASFQNSNQEQWTQTPKPRAAAPARAGFSGSRARKGTRIQRGRPGVRAAGGERRSRGSRGAAPASAAAFGRRTEGPGYARSSSLAVVRALPSRPIHARSHPSAHPPVCPFAQPSARVHACVHARLHACFRQRPICAYGAAAAGGRGGGVRGGCRAEASHQGQDPGLG